MSDFTSHEENVSTSRQAKLTFSNRSNNTIWNQRSESHYLRSSLMDYTNGNLEDNLKHGSLDFHNLESRNCDWDQTRQSIVTKADVPKNNVVDLNRIALGLDTRTTLMLRNIPNKVDQQMLKEYIDVTNENTYDFLCKFTDLIL